MRDIHTSLLERVALVFDALGHGLWLLLTLAAIAVLLLRARRWFALLTFAVAEGLANLVSLILKASIGRARPTGGLVEPLTSSFPSGHTTYAGATCVALVLLFSGPGPQRRRWWILAAIGVAGMAWSRTYLQVHWLSDVVAGALLGVGVSLVVFGAAQTLRRRAGTAP
jgi:undecaprenyl-diphosphatase